MTNEQKQEFTLRISQANRSELVVILYEMLDIYLNDAKDDLKNSKDEEFHDSIRRCMGCVRELTASINPESKVSGELLSLNVFAMRELASADRHHSQKELDEVGRIMHKLKDAVKKSAKLDSSSSIMRNSQSVYAGLTYGKDSLVVNVNSAQDRGYIV